MPRHRRVRKNNMPDNFELARAYRASFANKNVVIRVGRADVETPGTIEVENFKGEASMRYLAHVLIGAGFQMENIDDLFLVAVESGKPLFKGEMLLLKAALVRALAYSLN